MNKLSPIAPAASPHSAHDRVITTAGASGISLLAAVTALPRALRYLRRAGFAQPQAGFEASGRIMEECWGNPTGYSNLIDGDGFRPNVGIILSNAERRLFWGRRIGQNAWQFPQGGIRSDETPLEAMYRELEEEVGLLPAHVTVLGCTRGWLRYRLPKRFIRRHCGPICIGQKQVWYMLRVDCGEGAFCLDRSEKPEFDAWRWVRYWYPVQDVVYFKRRVYERALQELAPLLYPEGPPAMDGLVPQVQNHQSVRGYLRQRRR